MWKTCGIRFFNIDMQGKRKKDKRFMRISLTNSDLQFREIFRALSGSYEYAGIAKEKL